MEYFCYTFNMNIETIYKKFIEECNGQISTDTRGVIEGSLFFAWKGECDDGNKYAEEALMLGCSYVVMDNPGFALSDRCILVDNSMDTLGKLANFHRNQFNIPVIAITGSNGKTTTKELVASVLKTEKNIIAPEKSLNNQIGVSKTLLKITQDTEIAVIEMGANHIGEIAELCEIVNPNHGIITNVGRAHLGLFGGFDGVVRTKTELYRYIEKTDGTIFINGLDDILLNESNAEKKITYLSNNSDYPVMSKKTFPLFSLIWRGNTIKTNLTGEYNISNIAAAIAVGGYFKLKDKNIISGIKNYKPDNARSEIFISEKENIIIKDYYNANRNSMELSLENLSSIHPNKKKIAVLGDMGELGDFAIEEHLAVLNKAIDLDINDIILVGDIFSKLGVCNQNVSHYVNINDAILYLNKLDMNDSVILLKSSRGPNPTPAFEKIFKNVNW